MKRNFRITALVLCLAIVVSMLGACTDSGTPSQTTATSAQSQSTTAGTQATEAPPSKFTLPLAETLKVSYWIPFDTKLAVAYNSLNEVEFFNYIEEKLNIDFEFIEPTGTNEILTQQFGLMIASNDYADVMSSFDRFYSSGNANAQGAGTAQGFEDGVIIDIASYITEENMPNLKKFFDAFPSLKQLSSYQGDKHLTVPYFRHTQGIFSTGWIVRDDLFKANGWAYPETIDELDDVLYKMKDAGVKIPLMMGSLNATIGIPSVAHAYGMRSAYEYQIGDTHEVRFGAVQPEYKEMLDLLRKWYADKILDPDFLTHDQQTAIAKIAEGSTGIWFGAGTGDGINPWNAALDADNNTPMKLYGIPDLKVNKSDVVTPEKAYGTANNYQANNSVAISSQCKNVDLLLYAFDWLGYSNEGFELLHFGIEGEHFTREADGRVNRYVDVNGGAVYRVDADPSVTQWKRLSNGDMTVWAGNSPGPFINARVDFENKVLHDPTSDAVQVQRWFAEGDNSLDTIKAKNNINRINTWSPNWAFSDHSYNIPAVTYTKEQSAVRSEYYASIKTFIEEYSAGYILGTTDPSTYDQFVKDLYEKMNLQKVIDAIQGAVDEYYNR